MITRLYRSATTACVLSALFLLACGEDEGPGNPGTRLCGGEFDFGLRVTGSSQTRDLCLDDADVVATFNDDIYDITARFDQDNIIFEIQMVFRHQPDAPVALNVSGDLGAALSDPRGLWLFYQEIPAQGEAVESIAAAGGSFTLGFSGGDVATGTLSDISFEMKETSSENPAGARVVAEGFFSTLTEIQPVP